MQRLVTIPEPVLNADGTPNAGYCTQEMQYFERKAITADPMRIKEWDFYQIEDEKGRICLQLTYGHASYMGELNIMLFDISKKKFLVNKTVLIPLPMDSMKMPESADRDNLIEYQTIRGKVRFETIDQVRMLYMRIDDTEVKVRMTPTTRHSLIINIPFDEEANQFYYDFKQNCMEVDGVVLFSEKGKKKKIRFGKDGV